jgi:uncharacterized protein YpmB
MGLKKIFKKIWIGSKKSSIFALRKSFKNGLVSDKKRKVIFFSKNLSNQKELVLLHPL